MDYAETKRGIIALIIANTIWGVASPVFKWSLEGIPPFTLAFLRFIIATVIMAIVLRKKLRLTVTTMEDLRLLFTYALSGITFNIGFFFLGLRHTLAMNGPVIASASPILTFFFAAIFLHETIRTRKLAGMALGTMGILAIVLEPLLLKGMDGSVTGNLFLIAATVANAISIVSGRKLFARHEPVALMFWSFLIAAASFMPMAAYEAATTPDIMGAISGTRGIIGIAYGGIFSSTIAYTLFAWGLSRVKATDASMFAYVDPIAGTAVSVVALHEPLTVPFMVGTALIFGGIFLAEGRLHYHPFGRFRAHLGFPPGNDVV